MNKIVTPDCPQCGGTGFLRDGGNTFPCAQCCRRWDLANPCPSPRFMQTNKTMAEYTTMLHEASTDLASLWDPRLDKKLLSSSIECLQLLLQNAATFIESHDPSTKKQLSEAEAPYCNACEFDHVRGECEL